MFFYCWKLSVWGRGDKQYLLSEPLGFMARAPLDPPINLSTYVIIVDNVLFLFVWNLFFHFSKWWSKKTKRKFNWGRLASGAKDPCLTLTSNYFLRPWWRHWSSQSLGVRSGATGFRQWGQARPGVQPGFSFKKTAYPQNSFLLGFRSLYFEKRRKKENKKIKIEVLLLRGHEPTPLVRP